MRVDLVKHKLHGHPKSEEIYHIDKDKVIVDKIFGCLFSDYTTMESMGEPNHIIVPRKEFDLLIYAIKS